MLHGYVNSLKKRLIYWSGVALQGARYHAWNPPAKMIGQKKIARQELGRLAMTSALDELYGLGYANCDREDAQFEAVTLEDIKKVCATYLRKDSYVISIVQP